MTRCNFCGKLFKKKLVNSNIFEQLICPECADAIIKSHITIGVGILHYKEPEEMLAGALYSVDNQVGIDFNFIDVVVVTDGGGTKIDESRFKFKNIRPRFIYRETNGKCGGTRNTIAQSLSTDYIMFIDADDRFASNNVLAHVYAKVNKHKPELYCSSVLEEQYNGKIVKYKNLMCLNMCHGKAFKREIFEKYNLWFDPTIKIGEDLVFLVNLYDVCDNIIFDDSFYSYFWGFNKNSVTRSEEIDYTLDSYYRCFIPVTKQLNDWYANISKNKFVNLNFVSLMYNIFYYRICLTKMPKDLREHYFKEFFKEVKYQVNFDLLDKVDKRLNRLLLKNIPTFRVAYTKYKR